ncbi:tRNA1(Val) (adenine(37)-N6)-methyltransferase [Flavobacterium columnare]|uniref:tRNA1(Val) (adenine(37)-N6)-methyltransferase n=2 Tax=Flavobacterium TaxID=237 RepID=A0A2N9P8D4_9FLAO|nr:methyltransferase [Flavobacterium columnare]RVU91238.1 methyltransferase domain-containing protein [Flavobacterium columnare]SPE76598.1 tRNA1(Val) (adenine(37)-N6)-methyltransferase [Flavobacterium columnare]
MFQFKQFAIQQDRCAMKVGTDGVLLGAWTPLINNPYSILDIGSGSGLIALMLAQRSQAEQIDAIEIDDDAYEQCVDNFEQSPWNDRLYCYHAGLDEFVDEIDEVYDLIVSNPPFYTTNYKSNKESRDRARFEDSLPFEELIEAVDFFLSEQGIFTLIIPFTEEDKIKDLCNERSLFPLRITRVKGNPESEIKRSLMSFTRIAQTPIIDELTIEYSRHNYTEDYIKLTQDFYLKM